MHLLVSVTNAVEASAALMGGADFIDAKEPTVGALGAVSHDQFERIVRAIAGARPVTAALGDAAGEAAIERSASAFAAAGAWFVKVGFRGIAGADRIASLIEAAVRGAARARDGRARVVAVAYADADRARSISPSRLVEVAARSGANGVLLDTFDKRQGGLRTLVAPRVLSAWVATVHHAGLFAALAGKLQASDLSFVRDAGADIAGVRGAACEGGRTGRVSVDRVLRLREVCNGLVGHWSDSYSHNAECNASS